jgi:hypothetical protein
MGMLISFNSYTKFLQECWDYKEGEENETKENDKQPENSMPPISTNQASTPNISASENINVVAIDNKIEQAMDLVKTHLTFGLFLLKLPFDFIYF